MILKRETSKQIKQLKMKPIILMKKIKPGVHGPLDSQLNHMVQIDRTGHNTRWHQQSVEPWI